MRAELPLPDSRRVTVLFRIEPGCLGPEGASHVEDFCSYAERKFEETDEGFAHWKIVPRHDKALPETEYIWHGKKITLHQAERYLHALGRELDEFDGFFHDKLVNYIEAYFDRLDAA